MINHYKIKKALAASLACGSILAAVVASASVPAHADPATSPGQPCNDLDRIVLPTNEQALLCGGNGHGQPGLWVTAPTVDTMVPATLGQPCQFPGGTRADGFDPANNQRYLTMCSQDGIWTKYRP